MYEYRERDARDIRAPTRLWYYIYEVGTHIRVSMYCIDEATEMPNE